MLEYCTKDINTSKVISLKFAIEEKSSQDTNHDPLNTSKEINSFILHVPIDNEIEFSQLNTQETSPDTSKQFNQEEFDQDENKEDKIVKESPLNENLPLTQNDQDQVIEKRDSKMITETKSGEIENQEKEIQKNQETSEIEKLIEIPLHQEIQSQPSQLNYSPDLSSSTLSQQEIEKDNQIINETIKSPESNQNENQMDSENLSKKEKMEKDKNEIDYTIWNLDSLKDDDLKPYNSPIKKSHSIRENNIIISPIPKKGPARVNLYVDPEDYEFRFTPLKTNQELEEEDRKQFEKLKEMEEKERLEKEMLDELKLLPESSSSPPVNIDRIIEELNRSYGPEIEEKLIQFVEKKKKEKSFEEKENISSNDKNIPKKDNLIETNHDDDVPINHEDDIEQYEMSSDESILKAYEEESKSRRRAQSEIFKVNKKLTPLNHSLPLIPTNTLKDVTGSKKRKFQENYKDQSKKRKFEEQELTDEQLNDRAFRWRIIYERHVLLSKRKNPTLDIWVKAANIKK